MMRNVWQKTVLLKSGVSVLLRSPRSEDVDKLTRYANELSREDTFVVLSGETISREDESEYVKKWLEEIAAGNRIHLLAFAEEKLVANAEVRRVTKSRKRELHVSELSISVAKDWRGQGIGREILQVLIHEARSMGLRVLTLTIFANNTKAIELYRKLGFKVAGEIPGAILYRGQYIGHVYMYLPLV